jgi:hypothetical protein
MYLSMNRCSRGAVHTRGGDPGRLGRLVAQEGRTALEADPGATAAGRAELFSGRGSMEVERVRLPREPRCSDQTPEAQHAPLTT